MFLAAFWVYKLKQVDISLLKHIKPGFFLLLMPRVSIADRNRALDYLEAEWTVPGVARHVGVHQSTIYRLIQRHQQTNADADRPRSGRPRVTSERQDRHTVTSHLRDRLLPAYPTAQQTIGTHGRPTRNDTVYHPLRLHTRRPYVGQILTIPQGLARRNWAQTHRNCRNWQWQNI